MLFFQRVNVILFSRKGVYVLLLAAVLNLGHAGALKAADIVGDTVVLRALDKITARTIDMNIAIDNVVEYGRLRIKPRKCLKRPPEETPETSVFIEIEEVKSGQETSLVFVGWMFASSPGLNALEHPVYDVWVIDCRISAPLSEGESN